ncbi:family 16 glycosylhydrolase [Wenyingzhuangia sp. 2_MG-2023]|uniref:family 16 glycosylhydrolase n=1 Tax=Wenyingzhuangia sp. 2_MG-2023 TaxID=3062639 RepID=UPI0026E3E2A2|nr:family 16 glycosylhydrolase [Wenyingzhuangia sp. 2_MG-2023]MDO6738821.1 family 16 glycosylhydrolase [Wenyingzhuangia sp. 2_MG-2023]
MKIKTFKITFLILLLSSPFFAQKTPYIVKDDGLELLNKEWKLIKEMSDEFNGKKLDSKKWVNSRGGWIGRPPGLFVPNTVKVEKGELRITNYKLPASVTKNGKEFTHACGLVSSKKAMTYGFYECKMKASKTFMSSTFWLISDKRELSGCDKRTTELDIQECVGRIVTDKAWAKDADVRMGSNTHSRGIPADCDIVKGTKGAKAILKKGKVYEDFHTYGVWWKNKNEVLFFLDGELVNKVTPPADFNIPMHLKMVTETYDWNPVPADGGLTGSKKERTTSYDWVRTWKLVE